MPDVDIAWLVKELDSLGLRLTATPRLDGSLGLNKWRDISYWANADRAEALWAEHVGDDPHTIAALAAHVRSAASRPRPSSSPSPSSPPPSSTQPS
ncbi:hypothetical protein RA307_17910 [Xanthobacteraceae bacterium Astr-EGSB]|uniref:hypothetical protein n=1 Tax=Astrobacterium formosum TaxID=3069710 RepID=UPI0027B41C42|nr:hypothetical protein [Xanthobacteraceae bacterium Astr-EGSB]